MKGRIRSVDDALEIKEVSIIKFYRNYYKTNLLYVNRKYQRKLVWTLEEKKYLIDTIFRGFPISSFLLVKYDEWMNGEKKNRVEIIDGLQRLEAIISFMNGDYQVTVNGNTGYFNKKVIGCLDEIEAGTVEQKEPALPFDTCALFIEYCLSWTFTGKDDDEVEEIFRRINSTGHKLSKQELRQAGVTGSFSELIRRESSFIREDYTASNLVEFSDISKYSLNNKELNYGIHVDDVFWIKNDIITEDGLRRSKDEEIIANINLYLLTNGRYSTSASILNRAYNEKCKLKAMLDKSLDDEEKTIICQELFAKTIDTIECGLDGISFAEKLFTNKVVYNKDCAFIVIFCAIYNLLSSGMSLDDNRLQQFQKSMEKLGDNQLFEITSSNKADWNKEVRDRLINRVQKVFEPYFSNNYVEGEEWLVRMYNFLEQAEAETQMVDFKACICNTQTGKINKECILGMVKDLAAMVNTKPGEEGIVIIGIPDTPESADELSRHYGTSCINCRGYHILGIKDEAMKYFGSVDHYLQTLKTVIEKAPVSEEFKNYILANNSLVNYKGKLLCILRAQSSEVIFYDKKLYVRRDSHCHEIKPGTDEMNSFYANYYRRNN